MTIPSRIHRSLSRADETAAREVMGVGHPLVDLLSLRRARTRQLAVSVLAAAAGAVGVAGGIPLASVVLATSLVVAVAIALAYALARQQVDDLVLDLVVRGQAGAVPHVARERQRLASPRERERLARSLEHLTRDAWRWSRLHPASRPPQGVIYLRHATGDARAVSALLRDDGVSVEAVAQAERFLFSPDSPLFAQDAEALTHALRQVRRQLELGTPVRAEPERQDRLAA